MTSQTCWKTAKTLVKTPSLEKGTRRRKKVKGGNAMHVACFAEDPKEPELIGETMVDLTEVLTKGETDGEYQIALR